MSSNRLRAAILIISETASNDASTDKCIPALKDVFAAEKSQHDGTEIERWDVPATQIVRDDVLAIQTAVKQWTDVVDSGNSSVGNVMNLIVTSGGTGFAKADVTPEVSNARYLIQD
ncbi:hypothetical protein MRB53_041661 [Persea americana]|nr:hypothetical protein MRB53_041661 [Persea americana]